MKKIVAILVVLTLIAGTAFAQLSFSGSMGWRFTPLNGSTAYTKQAAPVAPGSTPVNPPAYEEVPSRIQAGAVFVGGNITANFSGDNYGGRVRLFPTGTSGWWQNQNSDNYRDQTPDAFVWVRPSEKFWFQAGHNPDGNFGRQQLGGWGFNAEAQDYVAIDNDSDGGGNWATRYGRASAAASSRGRYGVYWQNGRRMGFYPGFSGIGFLMTFTPMDDLNIDVVVPMGAAVNNYNDPAGGRARGFYAGPIIEVYKRMHVGFRYTIQDVGTAAVHFYGGGGSVLEGDNDKNFNQNNTIGKINASFWMPALADGIDLDIGVGYMLPTSGYDNRTAAGSWAGSGTAPATHRPESYAPSGITDGLEVGVGFRYTMDDFTARVRVGVAGLLGTIEDNYPLAVAPAAGTNPRKETTRASDIIIGFSAIPQYNLGNGLRGYFNFGFGMKLISQDSIDFYNRAFSTRTPGTDTWVLDTGAGQGKASPLYDTREVENATDWFINPYIRKDWGGFRLYAGVRLGSDGYTYKSLQGTQNTDTAAGGTNPWNNTWKADTSAVINWSIPIGFHVGF